ncbi:AI-2E family transporter [Sorangium sp. So ce834]|uniref:AI-2E family transporter n=1 Tax=Sorangium sp. So ce834 TaxID=3133321 RepID=UPI003F62CCB5
MADPLRPDASEPPPSSEMRAPAPPPTAVLPAAPPEPARERRALAVLAIAAVAAMVWITHPVGIGILLGTLNAFTMQPFYERMRARGRRPAVAAAIAVGLSSIVIVAVLAGISSLLVGRGVVLAGALIAALSPGAPARERVVEWTRRLEPLGLRADDLPARLRDAAAELAARAAGIAAFVASASFSALLGFFFVSMTTYFVLRHWTSLARRAEDVLPLHPRHTRALLDEFRVVGRTTLLGTVLTGIAQGFLAAIGFLITGMPEAAFFGAATAVASLIPAVGTLLVWVPAGVYLILTDHIAMGIVELAWGALVVGGISDYVIRPRLVGRGSSMPALFTFGALFGGVETFGLIGLLLGPLVMALAISTLRIYVAETKGRRSEGEARR